MVIVLGVLLALILGEALLFDVVYERGRQKGIVLGFRTAVTMLAEQVKEEQG